MVQLIEKQSTPKISKSTMGKDKKTVAVKAAKSPKLSKTPKHEIESEQTMFSEMKDTPKKKKVKKEKTSELNESPKKTKKRRASESVEADPMETSESLQSSTEIQKDTPKKKKAKKAIKEEMPEFEEDPMETSENLESSAKKQKDTPKKKKAKKAIKEEMPEFEEDPMETSKNLESSAEKQKDTPKKKKKSKKGKTSELDESPKKTKKRKASSVEEDPIETPENVQSRPAKNSKHQVPASITENQEEQKDLVKKHETRVMDLARHLTKEDLIDYFEKFGTVSNVTMPVDRVTKENRGFAFVAFSSDEEMRAAAAEKKHTIGGKAVVCVINAARKADAKKDLVKEYETRIMNLARHLTKEDLMSYFEKFGTVTNVTMPMDKFTGENKGFAFVAFSSEEEMKAAAAKGIHTIGHEDALCVINKALKAPTNSKKDLVQKYETRVMDIAKHLTKDDLMNYFEKFGTVDNVTLPMDKFTGENKGFAFVAFSSEAEMNAAAAEKKHTIGGKRSNCVINKPLNEAPARASAFRPNEVRVNSLNFDFTRDDVRNYFSQFGNVTNVTLPTDKFTGKNKGFAFVAFRNNDEVEAVIGNRKHQIGNTRIFCVVNKPLDS